MISAICYYKAVFVIWSLKGFCRLERVHRLLAPALFLCLTGALGGSAGIIFMNRLVGTQPWARISAAPQYLPNYHTLLSGTFTGFASILTVNCQEYYFTGNITEK